MPPIPGAPLSKITLQIFTRDLLTLKAKYREGYQVVIRNWVNTKANNIRAAREEGEDER